MVSYACDWGGHPGQEALLTGRSAFTTAYAVIEAGTMRDITASRLPFWEGTRAWVMARPMSGFAETFSQYALEIAHGGGSARPDDDARAEHAMFVCGGEAILDLKGGPHVLGPGGFAFVPAGSPWSLRNEGAAAARLIWIRKLYEPVEGIAAPAPVIASEAALEPVAMPGTGGAWATTRFTDPADMAHDMAVTIVTLRPGAVIPFLETHVMEHGLYVLQGKGAYRLNADWVEVEAGDFMWLRAFCPQACYAGGPEPFRYLLYKDVNRHAPLGGMLAR